MISGGDKGLEMTFTALVVSMAGILITYRLKSIPDSQSFVAQENEMHLASPQPPASEVEETKPLPAIAVATTSLKRNTNPIGVDSRRCRASCRLASYFEPLRFGRL